ncbi:MAG: hypothetical protein GX607_00310 [Myxococcales bacterium]|nr:hypothetical protein [Myxococcales bacterium]
MNTETLTKLEGLLERVRRNAAAPRPQRRPVVATTGVASPTTSAEADEERRAVAPAPDMVEGTRPPGIFLGKEAAREEEGPIEEELSREELTDDAQLLELDEPALEGVQGLEEEAEEEPESSRRVAASMDEALAGAADRLEPKTIPPESGPEPVTEAELARRKDAAGFDVPTTEQLGQTVPLEEGPHADFELDEPLNEPLRERAADASFLEAELPSGRAYGEHLAPPPNAREELERVRLGEVRAEVVVRPLISTNVVEFIEAHRGERPTGFAAIVDESLSLGG